MIRNETWICQEPPDELKKAIRGQKRRTLKLARHLWHGGWKCFSEELPWTKFVGVVASTYVAFKNWAAGSWAWKRAHDEFTDEADALIFHIWKTRQLRTRRKVTPTEKSQYTVMTMPEPEDALKTNIGINGRAATQQIASYLWKHGWKEECDGIFGWPAFMNLASLNFFWFRLWSRGAETWEGAREGFRDGIQREFDKLAKN